LLTTSVHRTVPAALYVTEPATDHGNPVNVRFALAPGGIVADDVPLTEIVKLVCPLIVSVAAFDEDKVNSFPLSPRSKNVAVTT
jgi:hypothetical protein